MVKTTGKGAKLDAANGNSQIRFRGTEDLGGGLKANFVAAMRLSPESGQADGTTNARPLFQGESTVGLSGNFGAVKIGRSLTPFQAGVNGTDPWGTLTQASTANLGAQFLTDGDSVSGSGGGIARTDHINYSAPVFNGVSVNVGYGFKDSNSTGALVTGANNMTSLWVSYSNGPVMVGAGTEKNRTGDKATALLATYDLGVVKLGAGTGTVDTVATAGAKAKNNNLMAVMPMGAMTFTLGWNSTKAENTGAETNKTAVGMKYDLSKRTYIYTTYGSTKTKSTGATATGYDVGLATTF